MAIDELVQQVDTRISRLIPETEITAPFYGMVKYHLGWVDEHLRPARSDAGKRIRARLCLLACEAAGGETREALPAATAVELVHNFSLIHDDIQDRSEYRRHRKTVWALWGDAQAINTGDDTFVLAQLALLDSGDPARAAKALVILNHACRSLCEGQFLDLDFEHRPSVSIDEYLAMIERKTAALLEAACHLGALFAGAEDALVGKLGSFGRQLGMAFQMRDDYLGIWGDPAETGKPAADDIVSKKKTLPILYAMETAPARDRTILREVMERPGQASREDVAKVLEVLDRCGAAAHTADEAERASDLALDALAALDTKSAARDEMVALCRKLAGRTS